MEDTSWINKCLQIAQEVVSSPALPAVISGIIAYWAVEFVKEISDSKKWTLGPASLRGLAFALSFGLFALFALCMGLSLKGTNSAYGFLGGAVAIGYFHGKKAVVALAGNAQQ
jgi:hypothetical protein